MKAVKRKESNTAWTKNPCYLQAIQGHSAIQGPTGGIPINPEMMGIHAYSVQLEGVYLSQSNFVEFSIPFGKWTDSGRKAERQSSTNSLLHTSESIR